MRISTTPDGEVTYAGIDYHKKFSVITLGDKGGNVIVRGRRVPNDRRLIREFFKDYPNLICTVECCRGYEWFVDYLKELGLEVHVCNAYQAKLIAQSRCKTDRVDSRILMELLAKGFLPTCYQATAEERELREMLRWRVYLVRQSTRIKLRVHALLDKENLGLTIGKLFNKQGKKMVEQLKLASPARRYVLTEQMVLLESLHEKTEKEDAWVTRTAKKNPDVQLLKSVPGIGDLVGLVVVAELGNVERFRRTNQVVAYAGLAPRVHYSANKGWTGSITKQGPPILRWVMVQAAWKAVDNSNEFRCIYGMLSKRCGKQKAIVAVARKLLEIAYRVLKDKTPYDAQRVATGSAWRAA
jgi:transposase